MKNFPRVALAAFALLCAFASCTGPDAVPDKDAPASAAPPSAEPAAPDADADGMVTVSIPLKGIAQPGVADTRLLTEVSSKPIADYYEVYFKKHGSSPAQVYFAGVKKGADVLAINGPAGTGNTVKYDVLFLVGKTLSSGALLLGSAFADGGSRGAGDGVPINKGEANEVSLGTVAWHTASLFSNPAPSNPGSVTPLVTGYTTTVVNNYPEGDLHPVLQIDNARPLIYAHFLSVIPAANGASTQTIGPNTPWLVTGTSYKFTLEPLGTPRPAWTPISGNFTTVVIDDANGAGYNQVLFFTGVALDDDELVAGMDDSFGRLTATASFYPYGVTAASGKAVTLWHIWAGENWYNLEQTADRTLGCAQVVQIGTPTDVELPAPDGLTTVIINPTL
jgi:hypothetical protein